MLFSGLNLEKSSSALSLKRTTKGFEGGLSLCSVSEGNFHSFARGASQRHNPLSIEKTQKQKN